MTIFDQTEYAYKNGYKTALENVLFEYEHSTLTIQEIIEMLAYKAGVTKL